MRIALVVNADWFFLSHRRPLADFALERGDEVFLLTKDTGRKEEIEALGIHFVDIPFERSGTNPIHELRCIAMLWRRFREIDPDVVHCVTLKAALLGATAAKLAGIRNVVNAISGLGYNFTDGRKGIVQRVVKVFLSVALKSRYFAFILQNPDDVEMFKKLQLVPSERIFLIKGSGVDLGSYIYTAPPGGNVLKVLFPARLLRDKGIIEYVEAAKSLRDQWKGKAVFLLAGGVDTDNLSGLSEPEVLSLVEPGYIEWIGFQSDMKKVYADSDLVVLPSYREGLPKSLIEACAIGRAIVTTNVPGCRECVKDGYNGYLVPSKTSEPLAESIRRLLENEALRVEMGRNSRKLAERDFSITTVVSETFRIYGWMSEVNGSKSR